jgi:hypothetical protein
MVAAPLMAQMKETLPTVNSYALDKSKVTLPGDLSGMQNVIVLYFKPDQSDAALAWIKGLNAIRLAHPGLKSYILPVYSKENFLYRWWIDASTRSGAPPSQDRHTTIPIFVDKAAFFRPLGITSEKEPFVLLTDKAGHVEWKTQGYFDSGKIAQLAAQF